MADAQDPLLNSLAEAVSDGEAVDWAAAESNAADPDVRRLLHELQVVSQIAGLHRRTLREGELERTLEEPTQQVWAHLTLREVIGRGAYGTVYRAWDPQLDREVALKLFPDAGGAQSERVVEEGRLLARVRHRGVVTVHGAARADGFVGVWMELIEGRTLEEVLQQQGRFSAREAALLGLEVCEALAAVHGAGLLHRDIKAQNVMRDRNGRIVLMDFGTGRVRDVPGETPVADLAGTPLYMAPELFRGERASVQSDVYGMGVLLYRLATGSFPVVARSLEEMREAHQSGRVRRLRDERSDLPGPFVQIVERALAPDPARRYESAGALELALTALLATTIDSPETAKALSARRKRWLAGLGLASAAALVAVTWWLATLFRPAAPEARQVRFLMHPPANTEYESFALSPDGRYVAFAAAGQLWMRALDAIEARLFPDTQGAHDPFWSPDSRSIAYFRGESLWVVPVTGGESRVIGEARNTMGGAWGPNNIILLAGDLGHTIWRVNVSNGARQAIRTRGRDGIDLRWPAFLPSGNAFLYSARKDDRSPRAIMAGRLDGGLDRLVIESESNAQVSEGRLIFVRDGKLFAQPFDERRLAVNGEATRVATRVPSNLYNREDYANFSAAASGMRLLAFLGARQVDRELRWFTRDGQSTKLLGPGEYRDFMLSHSGERAAFEQLDPETGARDIWILDVARPQPWRLTWERSDEIAPVWSSDDRAVYFLSNRPPQPGVYARAADGTGQDELVAMAPVPIVPFDASPDGDLLAAVLADPMRDLDLWLIPIARPDDRRTFRASRWRESELRFAPGGRWVAYSTTDTGSRHVYLERTDTPGPRWQVSVMNGRQPQWRADGRELYYHGPDRMLMAVSLDLSGQTPKIGIPRALFQLQFRGWDVRYHFAAAPDGQGFLLNVPLQGSTPMPITFVMNW